MNSYVKIGMLVNNSRLWSLLFASTYSIGVISKIKANMSNSLIIIFANELIFFIALRYQYIACDIFLHTFLAIVLHFVLKLLNDV